MSASKSDIQEFEGKLSSFCYFDAQNKVDSRQFAFIFTFRNKSYLYWAIAPLGPVIWKTQVFNLRQFLHRYGSNFLSSSLDFNFFNIQ